MYRKNKCAELQRNRIAYHVSQSDSYEFFNLLTSPQLLDVVEAQLPAHRERLFTPTLTLSMFMAQALNADSSCQRAVNDLAVKRMLSGLCSCGISSGGYCKARQRLPVAMISTLVQQTGALVVAQTPTKWLWRGRPVKLVDGTTLTMPDTEANQQRYPQQCGQKPGVGFPIARVVGVMCFSTAALLNAAMGPFKGKGGSEHALFRQLLDTFAPGDVVVADRYYCSYFLIAMLIERGVDVLFQQHAMRKTDFRKGQRLGPRDHIVAWSKPRKKPDWMTQEQYEAFPERLAIREVKANKKVLVTTLTSAKQAPKNALAQLYQQRWHIELDLRNIKTTLGMETLSCKTPQMNEKEMWVYFLAYNLIRLIMAQAALQADLLPRQLSFKHSLQIWVIWSQQQFITTDVEDTSRLFFMIASLTVGNRPGRIEPRAVKRRSKPYSLLTQPRHQARAEVKKNGHPQKLK
jgi:hypothetical protein